MAVLVGETTAGGAEVTSAEVGVEVTAASEVSRATIVWAAWV
jgi:hypothetical protein